MDATTSAALGKSRKKKRCARRWFKRLIPIASVSALFFLVGMAEKLMK
jgi:hypothetical protein